jgi:hypothetical protein
MLRYFAFFLTVSILAVSACTMLPSRQQVDVATATPPPTATPFPSQTPTMPDSTPEESAGQSATLKCQGVDAGDQKVYKKQTFAVDFEPFRGSCFVSTYDPQFGDDPPLQSEYAIYKNGKKVFDFPNQFNGVNFGCWPEAVAFQDLNGDKRNDVIVIGRCSGKSATYNENSVFINDGTGFTSRDDANMALGEFGTVRQVADFVRENRAMFF